MASCSCWRAPVYSAISAVLAFIAISMYLDSSDNNSMAPSSGCPILHQLSLNASRELRRAGFTSMASLLLVTPETFFSTPNATIFATEDSYLAKTSQSPWLIKEALQYHTVPLKLSMDDLLKMPPGSRLPTLLPQRNVFITKRDAVRRMIEINQVMISHPDVFLGERFAVHGVLRPLPYQEQELGSNQPSKCHHKLFSVVRKENNSVDWDRLVQLLSSKGFMSFALGLQSVLDGILEDNAVLESVTIFAPLDFGFLGPPSSMLERVVRFHILPEKYTYTDLATLPDRASLRTLNPDRDGTLSRRVVSSGANSSPALRIAVNGVEIDKPEICRSKNFMIHGISQAFKTA